MSNLFAYAFGPKLYMEYYRHRTSGNGRAPFKNHFVTSAENILDALYVFRYGVICTIPLIAFIMYQTSYRITTCTLNNIRDLTVSIMIIVMMSLLLRILSRWRSSSYNRFIRALAMCRCPETELEGKYLLRAFDFDFNYWPIDFRVVDALYCGNQKLQQQQHHKQKKSSYSRIPCNFCVLLKLPYSLIGYMGMRIFGIHIIYPGTISLLQRYLQPALIDGRAMLVQEYFGKRFKLKTIDCNDIDVMFIDNRIYDPQTNNNGNTLVICTEGNVGFYEVGIMSAPLALNYSIMGWNHPGFAGSSGSPFPEQDRNAIEAVVQFAMLYLGFQEKKIILYGWSIGCYATLWAAKCHPLVKGVILDAPFDDIWHIVQQHTPKPFNSFVRTAIREHCNINLLDLIKDFNGPILIIRRTSDEIVANVDRIDTNRGNHLVLYMLRHRYPNIFREKQIAHIDDLLALQLIVKIIQKPQDEDMLLMKLIINNASCDGNSTFPMEIGDDYDDDLRTKMAEYLLQKHLHDFEANHCTQLAPEHFNLPWSFC